MENKENFYEFTVNSLDEAEKVVKEVQKESKKGSKVVIKISVNPKEKK